MIYESPQSIALNKLIALNNITPPIVLNVDANGAIGKQLDSSMLNSSNLPVQLFSVSSDPAPIIAVNADQSPVNPSASPAFDTPPPSTTTGGAFNMTLDMYKANQLGGAIGMEDPMYTTAQPAQDKYLQTQPDPTAKKPDEPEKSKTPIIIAAVAIIVIVIAVIASK